MGYKQSWSRVKNHRQFGDNWEKTYGSKKKSAGKKKSAKDEEAAESGLGSDVEGRPSKSPKSTGDAE